MLAEMFTNFLSGRKNHPHTLCVRSSLSCQHIGRLEVAVWKGSGGYVYNQTVSRYLKVPFRYKFVNIYVENDVSVHTIRRTGEIDQATVSFVPRQKFLDIDLEIYERTIPVGLNDFDIETSSGLVHQRTAVNADQELLDDVDEVFVAADPELQPDDF
jgi:hypothetical protein